MAWCAIYVLRYDQSLRVIDIYIVTKFHYYSMFFNKLPIITPYIYDARYHAHPYFTKYYHT